MAKKVTAETYIDEAEKLLREIAPRKGLVVSRGNFDKLIDDYKHDRSIGDTVAVGLGSMEIQNPDPKIAVFFTCLIASQSPVKKGVYVKIFSINSYVRYISLDNKTSLSNLRNVFEQLPDF